MSDFDDFEAGAQAAQVTLDGLLEDATPAARPHVETACESIETALECHEEVHGGEDDE